MKIIYSEHTDPGINVEKLIDLLKTKEIEFSYIQKLADDRRLSGDDFGKIIVETDNTKGEDLMINMARKQIEYQLSLEKNTWLRDKIKIL